MFVAVTGFQCEQVEKRAALSCPCSYCLPSYCLPRGNSFNQAFICINLICTVVTLIENHLFVNLLFDSISFYIINSVRSSKRYDVPPFSFHSAQCHSVTEVALYRHNIINTPSPHAMHTSHTANKQTQQLTWRERVIV